MWRHKSLSALVQGMACCRQATIITWTNVELSSKVSCGVYLRGCSQGRAQKQNPYNNMLSEDTLNSSPSSAAYMRQWIGSALVQIMACRLFGAKPLSKPMLAIINWNDRNKRKWYFNRSSNISIQEIALKMSFFPASMCKYYCCFSQWSMSWRDGGCRETITC